MVEPPERTPIAHAPISVLLLPPIDPSILGDLLRGWAGMLNTLNRDYEILVIDNSGDKPAAGAVVAEHARVRLLSAPPRQGIGAALRAGLATARYPLLVYAACDPGYQPAELRLFLDMIDQVDMISGYRVDASAHRRFRLREYVYGWLVRLLFGIRLRDLNCAFKLFRRKLFARIPIQSQGSFVHAEVLAKANFLGCLIGELPITYQPNATPSKQASQRTGGGTIADAYRVFSKPDFGPLKAVDPAKQATP